YKYGKIVFDVIRGKLKIRDIKKAKNISKILMKIVSKKPVKIKEFKILNIKDVKMTINIHNKYTNEPDIKIEYILKVIKERLEEILDYYSNDGAALLGRFSKLPFFHPEETSNIRKTIVSLLQLVNK
ncbi:MAG: hypothetical protein GX638_10190, partial [Crenarchaeota archaeon]|nr:hypothetical protein [Thermoproteota archaeon]